MASMTPNDRLFNRKGGPNRLDHLSVGVLYGGPSAEREISIQSGDMVARALQNAGREVHRVILDDSFSVNMAASLEIDVAFLALHGEFGEDGKVQMILEQAGIPYTGSGVDASSMAFDKILAKRCFEKNGILSPAWMGFDLEELATLGGPDNLDLMPPVVVKPAASGSSLGISIVRKMEDAAAAIRRAFEFGESVLVERFVPGREMTVAILGDEPLPVIELRPKGEFFDYQAKYVDDTAYQCPANLSREMTNRVQAAALAAHRALGCRDVSRVDLIVDAQGMPWVLEVNTLPGLTSHSLLPKAAEAAGFDFLSVCEFLLLQALEHSERNCRAA
ncbi:MAG: D-alanine--D-alanine ligase [Planctomycetota bacterium]|nr:D-alanine--D-alanine ligase [Planctomycetota bacterium]